MFKLEDTPNTCSGCNHEHKGEEGKCECGCG
jgi:hypothetical protein